MNEQSNQQELTQSEAERFCLLSLDILAIVSLTGRIELVNPAAQSILGFSEAEVIGDLFIEFVHPEDRAASLKEFGKIAKGEPIVHFENRYLHKDGSYRWLAWTVAPDIEQNRAYAIGRDVTAQREVEQDLRRREEWFRTIYAHSPIAIELYDPQGRLIDANRACLEVFGVSRVDEVRGFKLFEDPNISVEAKERLRKGQTVRYEVPFDFDKVKELDLYSTARSGVIFLDVLIAPLFLNEGRQLTGYVVQVQDITARKRAEEERARLAGERAAREEAEAARRRTANILESITDAFFALDGQWRFTYVNKEAEQLLRRSREALIGKSVWDEFPQAVGSTFEFEYRKAVAERAAVSFEEFYPPLDTWFEVHAYPFEDGLAVYFQGIDERRRAAEALRTRERQQASVAELGQIALAGTNLSNLLDTAVDSLARELQVEYAKVMELQPGGKSLVLLSGVGWQEGSVGHARVNAGKGSQAGYTLLSGQPAIVEDFRTEKRFRAPRLLREHGVVSGVSVIIAGRDRPFGVLSAHATSKRSFTEDDIHFLQAIANILAAAIQRRDAVAARERLLAEINSQRRIFQAVVEHAPIGIGVLRVPGLVIEVANPALQAFLPGWPLLPGKTLAMAVPELAPRLLRVMERVVKTGEPYRALDVPFKVRRAPGAPVEKAYTTLIYVPLRIEGEQANAILTIVIETTEQVEARHRIEELARVAHRRAAELQGILDNMVDAVFVSDKDGRISVANKAAVQMLGMATLEDVRRALRELPELLKMRHPDGRPVTSEELPLMRALAGDVVVHQSEIFLNVLTQREVQVRTSAAPIKDQQERIVGAVAVVRDVTEMSELDRLKDQFILVAAHELKTPVAIMKGYAQGMLRMVAEVPAPARKMLEAIDRGADKIDRVVQDLLDISRLQAGHLELTVERIDLPALVEEVSDRLALTTSKHRIRVLKAEPVVLQGDRDRLEQVLTNYVDNALRYSPQGGDIDIEVEVREATAVVSVRDYGVGIPRDKQKRVFERFYRAHTNTPYDYGGMGVGLYISKEIVVRHGGSVWFKSEEGRGSTFYFSLPLGN